MSTTFLLIAVYASIGAGVGWYMGRHVYHHGTKDGIRPGNAGWSLFTMLVYGTAWPILAVLLVGSLLVQIINWNALAKRIFR